MKGLYVHIPFCNSICSYCDFPKIIAKDDLKEAYINKLIIELDLYKNYNVDTIFIGGGTPNSLPLKLLEKLLNKLDEFNNDVIEYTIELNPELINEDLVKLLSKHKINRVSMGVQTFNEKLLKFLGRKHTKSDIINSLTLLRKYNINNINLDLMFGIPYQTKEDINNDIEQVLSLDIKHISYYCLILEDRTILKYQLDKKLIEIPDDDFDADNYYFIKNKLENNGFIHYETSNYSKCGYESIHNLKYWDSKEYIGVGAGASGYLDSYRYDNNRIITKYLESCILDKEFISDEEKKKEFFMLGLRKIEGVSIKEYKDRFNSDPFKDFKLDELIKNNLIVKEDDYIKIKSDKLFLANQILIEFVGEWNEKDWRPDSFFWGIWF